MGNDTAIINQTLLIGSGLMALLILFIIALVMAYRQKQADFIEEKKTILAEKEAELANAKMEIAEKTMKEIGNELHDNLKNRVIAAEWLLRSMELPDSKKTEELISVLDELKMSLSDISKSLQGWYVPEKGLENALQREARILNQTERIKVSLSVDGNTDILTPDQELVLFRCTQEAMHNAHRHSGGSELEVRVTSQPNEIVIQIRDNGKGLTNTNPEGTGLANMKKRMELLGGEMILNSVDSGGTEVTLRVQRKIRAKR